MTLLQDFRFLRDAAATPELRSAAREAIVRAAFLRDESTLPAGLGAALRPRAGTPVPAKEEADVRRAVQGSAGATARPAVLQTHGWIVPPAGAVVDIGGLAGLSIDRERLLAIAGPGVRWKALYDGAAAAGMLPPAFPSVPLDFAIGDAIVGDARFRSYRHTFARGIYGIRGIARDGTAVDCGFAQVPPHGAGYDLEDLAAAFGGEFLIPTSLHLRLLPRPPVLRNLTFGFDDAEGLAEAADRLTRSGRPCLWANVYDEVAWRLVREDAPPGPLTLEVGVGGTDAIVAARVKALDGALVGFTAKCEAPAPWDGAADAYGSRSREVQRRVFVGEIATVARNLGGALERLRALGESRGARAGCFGSVTDTGRAYLTPCFDGAKEPSRVYDLSLGTADLVRSLGAAAFDSRLALLWDEDPQVQHRLGILDRFAAGLGAAAGARP